MNLKFSHPHEASIGPIGTIFPSAWNCLINGLARDPIILYFSDNVEMVIKDILVTYFLIALSVASSMKTLLFNLSFTFPFDHFFFPPFFEAEAALAIASLVFF